MPLQHPKPMTGLFLCSLLGLGLLGAAPQVQAAPKAAGSAPRSVVSQGFEPSASQLRRLRNAADVELWLAREVPEGLTLAEAPEFFADADEVFFNAEENLYVYAYRSAATGRWIAWVAFDPQRTGVVHTAAIDLDR